MANSVKRYLFGYPQGIGGHASTLDDPFDVDQTGLYEAFINISPIRGGYGWFCKRRAIMGRSSVSTYAGVPVARSIVQKGVDTIAKLAGYADGVKDVVWAMINGDTNQYDFLVRPYKISKLFSSSQWEGFIAFSDADTAAASITPYTSNVYAAAPGMGCSGVGTWIQSANGYIVMPMGTRDGYGIEYSWPMKAMWIDRDKRAPISDGFFANKSGAIAKTIDQVADNGGFARFRTTAVHGLSQGDIVVIDTVTDDYNGTVQITNVSDTTHFDTAQTYTQTDTGTVDRATNAGGTVGKSGYQVVPHKPFWYDADAAFNVAVVSSSSTVAGVSGDDMFINPGQLNNKIYRESGRCHEGQYRFRVCPIDESGEIGPPILSKELEIPSFYESLVERIYIHNSGILTRLDINGMLPNVMPNIRGFAIFVSYHNPVPDLSSWTNSTDEHGYALSAPPLDIPMSLWKIIDTNGRQLDPTSNAAWPSTIWEDLTATAFQWISSPRFNRQLLKNGFYARAIRTGDLALTIKSGQLFFWQFNYNYHSDVGDEDDFTENKVYIEIKGRYGYRQLSTWRWDNDTETVYITIEAGNNLPGTNGDFFDVAFVYPWVNNGTGLFHTQAWLVDPETEIDQSVPYPFPEEAQADYMVAYPHFTGYFENPAGTRAKCWDTWDGIEYRKDILWGTREGLSRFEIQSKIPGEITGGAYLTDTRFIVTTEGAAYLGQDYQDSEGIWHTKFEEQPLQYGHGGRGLLVHNRGIYGIDSTAGVWRVRIDPNRQREEISPIEPQRLLMTKSQQAWLRSKLAAWTANWWLDVSMIADEEKIVFAFPKGDGSATGGSKNNVSQEEGAATGSFWLTMYEIGDSIIWSYDYGSTTGTIPIYNLCIGVADRIFGDTRVTLGTGIQPGVFVNESDSDTEEQDNPSDSDVNDGIVSSIASDITSLPFRLETFPGEGVLWSIYPRLIKHGSNSISTSIVITPYRDNVAQTAVTISSLTTAGWQRGVKALGDSFKLQITDSSSGTLRLSEVQMMMKYFGSRRAR